jgi:hypothetical protein
VVILDFVKRHPIWLALFFVCAVAALMVYLALPKPGPTPDVAKIESAAASETVVINNNEQGDDSQRIQTALNNLNTGTASDPDMLSLNDNGSCFTFDPTVTTSPTDGSQPQSSAIVVDAADDNITITGGASPDNNACINRHSDPKNTSTRGYPLKWFNFNSGGSDNIKIMNLTFNGNGQGYVADANNFVDSFINTNPQDISNYQAKAEWTQNLWLQNLEMNNPEGMCGYTQHVYGFRMENVNCYDPVKDGFTLAQTYGKSADVTSSGSTQPMNVIRDSKALNTGDDALAISQCWPNHPRPIECADAGNFNVSNFHGMVDPDAWHGAALAFRGGADIVMVTNSWWQYAGVNDPNNTSDNLIKGAVEYREEKVTTSEGYKEFHANNVDVRNSLIQGANATDARDTNGVFLKDGNMSGVDIASNDSGDPNVAGSGQTGKIAYDAGSGSGQYCGIKATTSNPNTNDASVNTAANTYTPNNTTYNKCGFNGTP